MSTDLYTQTIPKQQQLLGKHLCEQQTEAQDGINDIIHQWRGKPRSQLDPSVCVCVVLMQMVNTPILDTWGS